MLAFRDAALETRVECIAAEQCKKLRLVDLVVCQYTDFPIDSSRALQNVHLFGNSRKAS